MVANFPKLIDRYLKFTPLKKLFNRKDKMIIAHYV